MKAASEKIAIVGLGYVGLPVAVAIAEKYEGTIGFDINTERIGELRSGHDRTGELTAEELSKFSGTFTNDPEALRGCTMFIVTVPTPVDDANLPDLRPVKSASKSVGAYLSPGAVVVYESTVYPGVTEDVCRPILAEVSGLDPSQFKLGYSPERINPGDKQHRLQTIVKVVAGEDEETLERVAAVYGSIVPAGIHRAPNIKVAEAAKVIENTQRDLNIALMNELAIVFDLMGIRTADVLAAAGTKWNFLKFSPGLVGGHCIGVDPYYLTHKAQELGYHPEVILAGRRINDSMGEFIAQKLVKMVRGVPKAMSQLRVGILGVTFKEDVPDIRNSRVPDVVEELRSFGIEPIVTDALADVEETKHEHGIDLSPIDSFTELDALIVAVPHAEYVGGSTAELVAKMGNPKVVIDIKSRLDRSALPEGTQYWSL